MKLRNLWLGDFYNLKDVEINFDHSTPLYDSTSIRFFIGLNGSGKSNALTAIGLIFSHLAADESPGIEFDIEYELRNRIIRIVSNPARVEFASEIDIIQPIKAIFMVRKTNERKWQSRHIRRAWGFSGSEVIPDRVVAYSTGPTSSLQWALTESIERIVKARVLASVSDVATDNAIGKKPLKQLDDQKDELRREKISYLDNPDTIFLGSSDALCAVLPLLIHEGPRASVECELYRERRESILKRVDLDPIEPVAAFTLRVAGDWNSLFRPKDPRSSRFAKLVDEAVVTMSIDAEMDDETGKDNDFYAVYDNEKGLRDMLQYGRTDDNAPLYETPLSFCEDLLAWQRLGAVTDIQLALKKQNVDGLLPPKALSDGEYLYLGRFALLLMLREVQESLILLDEPETHFNDHWKVELVNDIFELLKKSPDAKPRKVTKKEDYNEVIIATHSDLTLTDADPKQVYQFVETGELAYDNASRQIEVKNPPDMFPFAANRGEISRRLFSTKGIIGTFSQKRVADVVKEGSKAEIEQMLQTTGPGYAQFQLLDRLVYLEEQDNVEGDNASSN